MFVCYTCMHVGLCLGSNVTMFHVWCVLHNFSFCKTAEEYEGSVMHIEVVPSTLMRVNVYDYPMYLVCGFSYF